MPWKNRKAAAVSYNTTCPPERVTEPCLSVPSRPGDEQKEIRMGRTVPTFTMVLQQEIESWGKYRRGLRREDQEAFDDLFRAARLQLASSAYAARPIPFECMAMSMLLAQHALIRALERRIAALERDSGTGGDDGETDDHRMAV